MTKAEQYRARRLRVAEMINFGIADTKPSVRLDPYLDLGEPAVEDAGHTTDAGFAGVIVEGMKLSVIFFAVSLIFAAIIFITRMLAG